LNEAASASLALQFIEQGYTKVYILKGGWNGWVKAKFPAEGR
jgi:rhodanese-related sulfurtransferase